MFRTITFHGGTGSGNWKHRSLSKIEVIKKTNGGSLHSVFNTKLLQENAKLNKL
jgi:hypothetical protein